MKKWILISCLSFGIVTISIDLLLFRNKALTYQNGNAWVKVKGGIWMVGEQPMYKIGGEEILLFSKDVGKHWEFVALGVWQGKSNHWYKYKKGRLFVSDNSAKDWVRVNDNKWEADDGSWYLLDEKAKLWISKPKSVSLN